MATVTLTPEQERFAAEAIAQGRFSSMDEIVQASMALLQRAEADRVAFIRSLEDAEAEGERLGFLDAEDVFSEMRAMLDTMRGPHV